MNLLRYGIRPSDILTPDAFENAIASVATTSGSTNAVLHLLAISRETGAPLDIDDFQTRQRAHSAAGRPETCGQICCRRCARSRRHSLIAKRLLDGRLSTVERSPSPEKPLPKKRSRRKKLPDKT